MTTADDLGNAECECGHTVSGAWHTSSGCQWFGAGPHRCPCDRDWPEALLSSGLLDRIKADAARDALTEAADALEGRLGTKGAPRNLYEFRQWLRVRVCADRIGGDKS